jgi:peptidoglycan/LPS O-acetylase OafA/YrhL
LQFLLPQFLGWFGLGMMLSVGVAALQGAKPNDSVWFGILTRKPGCWSLAVIAYLGAVIVIGNDTLQIFDTSPWWKHEISHTLLGLSACLVLLPLTVGSEATLRKGFFSTPPMREVGLVSYGVYLWHDIVLKYFSDQIFQYQGFVAFLVLLCLIVPVSLVLGWLSFRLVERPAMRISW